MSTRCGASAWLVLTIALGIGTTSARADLIDNGDGTITDSVSGLMWLKNANTAGAMSWSDANTWVQTTLNGPAFAGHADWRLPSGANPDGTVCNSASSGANCVQTEFATLYFARLIMAGNPGPFQNLQYGTYWTATDLPGDASKAMAQDFIDGGQNPQSKTSHAFVWAVRTAGTTLPPGTPVLYGVISSGTNAGALVRIDTQNGAVSIVGPTGFTQACGLAFDRIRQKLYLSPCFGTAGLQVIDTNNGSAASMGTTSTGVRSITHRYQDDNIYGIDVSPALLRLDAETGGSDLDLLGIIDKVSIGGIAARPADGRLFGAGRTGPSATPPNSQQLFTLSIAAGSGPRDTNVGQVPGTPLRALAFHPDGRLFATDGSNLKMLDPSTGAVLSTLPLTPSSVGTVNALAVSGPRVSAPPDAWIKDCAADTGDVPSSPTPCTSWTRSPDIFIDNNNDGVRDPLRLGQTNIVRVIVRNRGLGPANNLVVRLHYLGPSPPTGFPLPSSTLVGQLTVTVPRGAARTVPFPVPVPRPAFPKPPVRACLAVVLSHPRDPATTGASVPRDNNKAVNCYTVSAVP